MVAIKDMEMPTDCYSCFLLASDCPVSMFKHDRRADNCPLVEIEERKHGKWEYDKLFGECAYVCSFCHTIWTSSEIQNMHYCPTCGAEMKGEEE